MRLQGRIVVVLLVDKEPTRLRFVLMYLVHNAARFFARFFGQFRENTGHFSFTARFRHPGYRQNHHLLDSFLATSLLPYVILLYLILSGQRFHLLGKFIYEHSLLTVWTRGDHSDASFSFLFHKSQIVPGLLR